MQRFPGWAIRIVSVLSILLMVSCKKENANGSDNPSPNDICRLVELRSDSSTFIYSYDANGRVVSYREVYIGRDARLTATVSLAYNAAGLIESKNTKRDDSAEILRTYYYDPVTNKKSSYVELLIDSPSSPAGVKKDSSVFTYAGNQVNEIRYSNFIGAPIYTTEYIHILDADGDIIKSLSRPFKNVDNVPLTFNKDTLLPYITIEYYNEKMAEPFWDYSNMFLAQGNKKRIKKNIYLWQTLGSANEIVELISFYQSYVYENLPDGRLNKLLATMGDDSNVLPPIPYTCVYSCE